MISSVSNVNFRGDAAPVNAQDLINSPGKFTTQAPKADAPADSFEKEGAPAEKKKSKAPAIIGTIVGLLAATYVGLSIAVGKKALTRAVAEEGKELGFLGKVKNFFVDIGESGEKLWNKIRGKKVDDVDGKPKTDAPDVKKSAGEEVPKTGREEAPKTGGEEVPKTGVEEQQKTALEEDTKTAGEEAPKTAREEVPKTGREEVPKTEGENK
uniref:hypothetical protein n=1 Tax=Candidatus Stercorousia sp. TaxID=3048886 RepID=UPI004029024B